MEHMYRVNTFAPMYIESKLFELIDSNSTYVVNIISSMLVDYYPKFVTYASTKAALAKFTQDLKKSLKDTGARVLDVSPSGFKSNIYKTMIGEKVIRDESKQMNTEDLASLIFYLVSLPKKMEASHIYIDRK